MRLFVVSDIHGHSKLLKAALEKAHFDPANQNHLLICCGDLFNRGTENLEVLRFFEQTDRKILIKGNHEDSLFDVFALGRLGEHEKKNGTINTLQEVFCNAPVPCQNGIIDFSSKAGIVNRFTAMIGEMRDYYETDHYIFVHGWLPNENGAVISDWRNASRQHWYNSRRTRWIDGYKMTGNKEKKTIVCGHYPTMNAEILYGEGFISIDAGTNIHKRVNVLIINDQLMKEGEENEKRQNS